MFLCRKRQQLQLVSPYFDINRYNKMNNRSLDIQRKPNSHTKLPKIPSNSLEGSLKRTNKNKSQRIIQNLKPEQSTSKSQFQLQRNSIQIKLSPLQNNPLSKIEALKNIKQANAVKLSQLANKQDTGVHKINLPKRNSKPSISNELNDKKPPQENINKIARKTINSERTKSQGSSREANHIAISHLSPLLSHGTQAELVPDKIYAQKKMGDAYADWWCVVDSIMVSLQKLIKIKKIVSEDKRAESPSKNAGQNLNGVKVEDKSPSPTLKKKIKKNSEPIKGKVVTNLKASIEFSHAYSCLEPQLIHNQRIALKAFQDPNHIMLVLEAYFYEKACMFLLGSIRKWHHQDQQFFIHSLAIDLIPCIKQNRKLLADIIMEAVENEQQDTKIRKPKYIARQKKLIQISKFVNLMKELYEKCMRYIGSPNRYKIFYLPEDGFKEHEELIKTEISWRHIIFNVPSSPYISSSLNNSNIVISGHKLRKKQYMLVLEPLGILYKYNKKEENLHIYPYAQDFLSELSEYFHIILYTHADKEQSMLNFMGCLENQNIQIPFILDKEHMRYRKAKLIKDISKIGGGEEFIWDEKNSQYGKILIMDDKINCKYYCHFDQKQKEKLFLVEGNHAQTRLGRVGGKLVKIQEDNQYFLKHLSQKIIKCAMEGGNWNPLIKQSIK